jgi:hypothetical protein|tara:strand:+ start:574 stop:711 length:138 start_codon:yes stop_codon:yes gene_type:complete
MIVSFSNGDELHFPNVPEKESPVEAVVQKKEQDWVRNAKGNWVRG